MKLYYFPGACSLSPHIVLREIEQPFDLERVDLSAKVTELGEDFLSITPKGMVPVLELDDGRTLTEGAAIVQYLADSNPQANLVPEAGTFERAQAQSHINYISSELQKAFSPLFHEDAPAQAKAEAPARIGKKLAYFEQLLSDGREYVGGNTFSIVDAYLFTVVRWCQPTGVSLAEFPNVSALLARVSSRPTVQAALAAEG